MRKNGRSLDQTSRLAALGRLQLHGILRQLDLSLRLEIIAAIRDLPQHPTELLHDPSGGAFSEESFSARQAAHPLISSPSPAFPHEGRIGRYRRGQ